MRLPNFFRHKITLLWFEFFLVGEQIQYKFPGANFSLVKSSKKIVEVDKHDEYVGVKKITKSVLKY